LVTLDKIVDKARKEGRTLLTEIEAKEMLKQAGIDVVETRLAANEDEAVSMSREFGFPVVLKIASPDVVHKSDAGGVKLGLKTSNQVAKAYEDIMKSIREKYPKAKIQGASVQKMARPGVEVIIGMSKDAQFGPVIMFGLGGVMVEALKDVAFRVAPLAEQDARDMLDEVRGSAVLGGFRGGPPVDRSSLVQLLLRVSDLVATCSHVGELDLNPVLAYPHGLSVVDARLVLETRP